MDRTEVETRVKKVISSILKTNKDNISSTANFVFDLGADSMQSLQLVAGFEEEFNIEMDEEMITMFLKLKKVVGEGLSNKEAMRRLLCKMIESADKREQAGGKNEQKVGMKTMMAKFLSGNLLSGGKVADREKGSP